ncbi:c-type cytochrome [Ideonella livida]|uniref:C-type cytochrome n=1 Tax=Ideonella livida TaxID=2707176 RepID=A0A7C9TH00_9BURK|nr:c-type cytochrome [Ideonella livida]NDY90080.1 c-type cytochrome [Ideonella livida]
MALRRVPGRFLGAGLLALAAFGGTAAQAETAPLDARLKAVEADPAQLQLAVNRGRKLANFCANCHGANGNSPTPDTPTLAGQGSQYLLEQMNKFATGQRRDPFMVGLIKAMSDTEKVDAVLFYNQQQVLAQQVDDAAAIQRGKTLFTKVCFRCHGNEGMGQGSIPRVAGQKRGYLVKSITRYRDGTGERIDPLMASNTKFLSNEDITGLAAYLASLR